MCPWQLFNLFCPVPIVYEKGTVSFTDRGRQLKKIIQCYQLLFIQKLSTINIAAIGTHPSKFTVLSSTKGD
jgi:hypothetical protein